jgi:hypothetical protein
MKKIIASLLFTLTGFVTLAQTNRFHNGRESVVITDNDFYTTKSTISVKSGNNTMLGSFALANLTNGQNNTGIGTYGLASITSVVGNENTAVGFGSLLVRSQDSNIAFGNTTLFYNGAGERNIAIGDSALFRNGNMNNNIGIGNEALKGNNNGSLNLVIGHKSVPGVSGSYNLVIGHESLLGKNAPTFNHTAGFNTLIGNDNMKSAVNAYYNIGIGNNLLTKNETGYSNIAFGKSLLANCVSCKENIALGGGMNTDPTPERNIAVGFDAMKNTSNSRNSIGIGVETLLINQGEFNIGIGQLALSGNTTGKRNVAVGLQALIGNVSGDYQVAIGTLSLGKSTGDYNIGIGYVSGRNLISGANNIFIGAETDCSPNTTNQSNSLAIGRGAITTASNKFVFGNASVTQIGALVASYTVYSDRRLKRDITYVNKLGLRFINQLKTATYQYKSDSDHNQRNGLIAQDVLAVTQQEAPDFDLVNSDNSADQLLSIRYAKLTIPLINSVKELNKKLTDMQEETAAILAENEALKTLIANHKKLSVKHTRETIAIAK